MNSTENRSIAKHSRNDDLNFFSFGLCHVCKLPDNNSLKACSACKSIYYCSKEHQKQDWNQHKQLCKTITKINALNLFPYKPDCSPKEFNQYKYSTGLLWSCDLARPLQLYEQQMWMFPRVCAICYTKDVAVTCPKCVSVGYCSELHQKQDETLHADLCKAQELSLNLLKYIYQGEETEYKEPKLNLDTDDLPANTEEIMKCLDLFSSDSSNDYMSYILMAEYFCSAPTIIYALEKIKIVDQRKACKDEIIFHIVGFDAVEEKLRWEIIAEFIGHWITDLQSLKLYCVGPEVMEEYLEKNLDNDACSICKGKRFHSTVSTYKALYHEVIGELPKPDLVIAFNSGLSEYKGGTQDTWQQSIPCLIKQAPLLITAYTKSEMQDDLARFETPIKFLLDVQKNPYCGLIPVRNWAEITEPVFYQNGYIAIIVQD